MGSAKPEAILPTNNSIQTGFQKLAEWTSWTVIADAVAASASGPVGVAFAITSGAVGYFTGENVVHWAFSTVQQAQQSQQQAANYIRSRGLQPSPTRGPAGVIQNSIIIQQKDLHDERQESIYDWP